MGRTTTCVAAKLVGRLWHEQTKSKTPGGNVDVVLRREAAQGAGRAVNQLVAVVL